MKRWTFITIILFAISCNQVTHRNTHNQESLSAVNDTVIVKKRNELNKHYEVGFYLKLYSYYQLVGRDTLDFTLNISEYVKDSTIHLTVFHRQPMFFKTALEKIYGCFDI